MNMPTAAKPAAPASRTSVGVAPRSIPPIAIDRQRRARARLPKRVEPGHRMARAACPAEGNTVPKIQIVAAAVGDGGVDLRQRVHRAADEKRRRGANGGPRRATPARESPRRCTPAAPAAIAMSARSLTSTRAAVPRGAATISRTSASQRRVRQIALAHLDDVHAGARGVRPRARPARRSTGRTGGGR